MIEHREVITAPSSGSVKYLDLEDKRVYYVSGFRFISFNIPDGFFNCHVFVSTPDESNCTIHFPASLNYYGQDIVLYGRNQTWEFSFDSEGGIIGAMTS